jgi:putative endonuclease
MKKDIWSVYIIKCRDGKLYTGISNDVAHRVAAHSAGKGCRFTKYRYPVELVYQEECGTKSDARKREIQVQNLQRYQKLELAALHNKNRS